MSKSLEYNWNLNSSLPYVSPSDIDQWIKSSGLTAYIEEIAEEMNADLAEQLYFFGHAKVGDYIEYSLEGVVARINAGMYQHSADYYFEIWHKDEMILSCRMNMGNLNIQRHTLVLSPNDVGCRFIAYCLLYTSAMLLDDVLLSDQTESKLTRVDGIIHLSEGEDVMRTKVFYDEYKGHTLFAIWEIDENGNKVGKKPKYSFGMKKAKVLAPHVGEIDGYLEANKGKGPRTYDTSKLSSEDKAKFEDILSKMS